MAYNMPFNQAVHSQQPFFGANMSNQPILPQESLTDIKSSWMENIDPLLRQARLPESNLAWQQQPLERFITEPERSFFTTGPLPISSRPQPFPILNRPSEGIHSIPQATRARMASPSPSGASQERSQCSTATSPPADPDWLYESYYSLQQDDFSLSNCAPHLTQGFPELWDDRQHGSAISQLPFVNLNEVQGIPDPEEVSFEGDEGLMDMSLDRNTNTIEVDHQVMKTQAAHHHHTSYRHSSDEGLGASLKDGNSPQESTSHVDIDDTTDLDADAEAASDTEYSPKTTRSRKRPVSKASSDPVNKRSRVSKPAQKSKNSLACKSCNHPFKDTAALQHHVNSTHTRAFICVFGFAGCTSTFASKNEWKRHVSSQHLNLSSWVCELGSCGKVQTQSKKGSGGAVKSAEFNRKDLFTQHLRRMHAPFAVKRMNKKNAEWEDRLKDLQVSCLRVKRHPPTRLGCPQQDCDSIFEGASCWDDRMEHVGKHLEKAAASTGPNKISVEQEDDALLVNWALRERIVERKAGGGYKLCGAWFEKADDEDAEDEYV